MNTHDVADVLVTLANVLRATPNHPLDDLVKSKEPKSTREAAKILTRLGVVLKALPDSPLSLPIKVADSKKKNRPNSVPAALRTLLSLIEYDKQQWLNIIQEYNFPIDVRVKDSSRDILGKLLKHLEKNEESREKLTQTAKKSRSETSPELLRALQILLSNEPTKKRDRE